MSTSSAKHKTSTLGSYHHRDSLNEDLTAHVSASCSPSPDSNTSIAHYHLHNNALIKSRYMFIISRLRIREAFALSLQRLFKKDYYYVLKARLGNIKTHSIGRPFSFAMERACQHDINALISQLDALDMESRIELISRLLFSCTGLGDLYISKNTKGEFLYMQWLIYPAHNHLIKSHFSNRFYPLNQKQVMIENAFTFPGFRGIGLLKRGTGMLLKMAREEGFETAVTYVRKDRIAILNDLIQMGFKITRLIKEYKIFGATHRNL